MTPIEAINILEEMQKWRRGEDPYDGETPETHREMPYTAAQFGKAIDVGIYAIKKLRKVWPVLKENE